jgi:hypothetical protein
MTRHGLKVNRELSGMYGVFPIKAVSIDGDTVRFSIVMQFSPRTFEINFAGKLADSNPERRFGGLRNFPKSDRRETGTFQLAVCQSLS